MRDNILLDTCAAIWITEDARISDQARSSLNDSYHADQPVMLSPMTAWEMGMLVARGRYAVSTDVQAWFDQVVESPNTALAELSPAILVRSSFLPGTPPPDPFDRVFIATAREHGYRLMTRDQKILDYAAQGHVRAIAC